MPGLLKYFGLVGVVLWALVSLASFLLEPSTGATLAVATEPKSTIAIAHDPRASKIERWRDEQAALQAAAATKAGEQALFAARFTAQPGRFSPPARSEPERPQAARPAATIATAPAKLQPASEPVSIVGVPTAEEIAAARGHKAAERKVRLAKARARKERLAREQVAPKQVASNQQDQYYYGQRNQQPATPSSPGFQPQPSYGSFAGVRPNDAARAPEAAGARARVAKAKSTKKARTREARRTREGAQQRYAARDNGSFGFGQHGGYQSTAMPRVSAFAPQQSYGPFGRTW